MNITSCQFSSPQSSSTTQNPCLRGRTIESQPATPRSYHLVRLYGYDSTTYSTLPQTNAGAVPSLHAGIKYINPRLCIGKLGFSPSRRASLTILGCAFLSRKFLCCQNIHTQRFRRVSTRTRTSTPPQFEEAKYNLYINRYKEFL